MVASEQAQFMANLIKLINGTKAIEIGKSMTNKTSTVIVRINYSLSDVLCVFTVQECTLDTTH